MSIKPDIEDKLLRDKRVIDEIHRHLWFESEKAGYDIGFDTAKGDWLKKFSKAWMEYHMPEDLIQSKSSATNKTKVTKRRAKSYL